MFRVDTSSADGKTEERPCWIAHAPSAQGKLLYAAPSHPPPMACSSRQRPQAAHMAAARRLLPPHDARNRAGITLLTSAHTHTHQSTYHLCTVGRRKSDGRSLRNAQTNKRSWPPIRTATTPSKSHPRPITSIPYPGPVASVWGRRRWRCGRCGARGATTGTRGGGPRPPAGRAANPAARPLRRNKTKGISVSDAVGKGGPSYRPD
jgi:hypothetical protein